MTVLFWISALIAGYVYVGYPCLLAVWARIADRRPRALPFQDGAWPSISIIIAARNEAQRLPARVANLLDQDYPGPREIVVSDGSTDHPDAALSSFGSALKLVEVPAGGKPLALNAGVAAATGEVLVFADARQRFAPGSLTALISNLSDPSVDGATGGAGARLRAAGCRHDILAEARLGKGFQLCIYDKNVSLARLVGAKQGLHQQADSAPVVAAQRLDRLGARHVRRDRRRQRRAGVRRGADADPRGSHHSGFGEGEDPARADQGRLSRNLLVASQM
jgi:cellulose synthase/poly-beta-1,6-N-acetylglucosamine synthase-like glycosyltransferase